MYYKFKFQSIRVLIYNSSYTAGLLNKISIITIVQLLRTKVHNLLLMTFSFHNAPDFSFHDAMIVIIKQTKNRARHNVICTCYKEFILGHLAMKRLTRAIQRTAAFASRSFLLQNALKKKISCQTGTAYRHWTFECSWTARVFTWSNI